MSRRVESGEAKLEGELRVARQKIERLENDLLTLRVEGCEGRGRDPFPPEDIERDTLGMISSKNTAPDPRDGPHVGWSWSRGANAVREALIHAVVSMPDRRISRGCDRIDEAQFNLARQEILYVLRGR